MDYSVRSNAASQADRVDANWGSLCWLAGKAQGNAKGFTLGRVTIKPGQSNPAHIHHTCEEALYLLSGRLRHYMGQQEVVLEPGDTLVVAAGVPHHAVSIGDVDADMIVVYDSAERDFDKVRN